jgi:hypothetical protein
MPAGYESKLTVPGLKISDNVLAADGLLMRMELKSKAVSAHGRWHLQMPLLKLHMKYRAQETWQAAAGSTIVYLYCRDSSFVLCSVHMF